MHGGWRREGSPGLLLSDTVTPERWHPAGKWGALAPLVSSPEPLNRNCTHRCVAPCALPAAASCGKGPCGPGGLFPFPGSSVVSPQLPESDLSSRSCVIASVQHECKTHTCAHVHKHVCTHRHTQSWGNVGKVLMAGTGDSEDGPSLVTLYRIHFPSV